MHTDYTTGDSDFYNGWSVSVSKAPFNNNIYIISGEPNYIEK